MPDCTPLQAILNAIDNALAALDQQEAGIDQARAILEAIRPTAQAALDACLAQEDPPPP